MMYHYPLGLLKPTQLQRPERIPRRLRHGARSRQPPPMGNRIRRADAPARTERPLFALCLAAPNPARLSFDPIFSSPRRRKVFLLLRPFISCKLRIVSIYPVCDAFA